MRRTCLSLIALLAFDASHAATVPVHFGLFGNVHVAAPAGEPLSADYEVTANGQKVDVYTARVLDPPFAGKEYDYGGPYCFANFDASGRVEVRITSPRSLRNTVVRPAVAGFKQILKDDYTLVLSLPGPVKLSVEPEGRLARRWP